MAETGTGSRRPPPLLLPLPPPPPLPARRPPRPRQGGRPRRRGGMRWMPPRMRRTRAGRPAGWPASRQIEPDNGGLDGRRAWTAEHAARTQPPTRRGVAQPARRGGDQAGGGRIWRRGRGCAAGRCCAWHGGQGGPDGGRRAGTGGRGVRAGGLCRTGARGAQGRLGRAQAGAGGGRTAGLPRVFDFYRRLRCDRGNCAGRFLQLARFWPDAGFSMPRKLRAEPQHCAAGAKSGHFRHRAAARGFAGCLGCGMRRRAPSERLVRPSAGRALSARPAQGAFPARSGGIDAAHYPLQVGGPRDKHRRVR